MVDDSDLLAWITQDANAIADLSDGHGGVAIPTCEGWVLDDLLAHLGGFFTGWYTFNLSHDATAPDPIAAVGSAAPVPDSHAELLEYLRRGVAGFVAAAGDADLDAEVWGFDRAEPARYWVLRAMTETAVHLWDATAARAVAWTIDPDQAAESIDETLRGMWSRGSLVNRPMPEAPDEPLLIHAVDSGRSWLVDHDDSGRVIVHSHVNQPAGSSVAGSSGDLMLWLWGRPPTSSLQVTGSQDVADGWNLLPRYGL